MKTFGNTQYETLVANDIMTRLLEDFSRLYYKSGKIPTGTYLSPTTEAFDVTIEFLKFQDYEYEIMPEGKIYVYFPKPKI